MNNEGKIISMLEKIMEKQDEHSDMLNGHNKILNSHSDYHEQHKTQFAEHNRMISALLTGQEYLKAQINEMQLSNAK